MEVPNAQLWSPDHPFLYDVDVWIVDAKSASSASDVTTVDHVKAYTGIRKIELAKDESGTIRTMLNGEFIFQVRRSGCCSLLTPVWHQELRLTCWPSALL